MDIKVHWAHYFILMAYLYSGPEISLQHYVEKAENNRCYTTAIAQLETSNSIFKPLSRQDDILCNLGKEKCENNAFENSETFADCFCGFLF